MDLSDNIKNLIHSAFDEKKDVFLQGFLPNINQLNFDDVKTLVLLPEKFFSKNTLLLFNNHFGNNSLYEVNNILFSCIKNLVDQAFLRFIQKQGFKRFVIMFAECMLESEHGYKESYRIIGEMRDEGKDYFSLVCFISPYENNMNAIADICSVKDAILIKAPYQFDFCAERCISQKDKKRRLLSKLKKSVYSKTVIYCNSRGEANELSRFFTKHKTEHLIYTGQSDEYTKRMTINTFKSKKEAVIIVTKSFLSESFFLQPDNVLFCGVPFSLPYLYRCLFSCANSSVIFCPRDYERNQKMTQAYSLFLGSAEIISQRKNDLIEVKKILQGS